VKFIKLNYEFITFPEKSELKSRTNINYKQINRLYIYITNLSNTRLQDSHIQQFIYFRKFKDLSVGELFRQFIIDITRVYPGFGKNGLKGYDYILNPNLHAGYIS